MLQNYHSQSQGELLFLWKTRGFSSLTKVFHLKKKTNENVAQYKKANPKKANPKKKKKSLISQPVYFHGDVRKQP